MAGLVKTASCSRQHHYLSACPILLHASMCINNLVEMEDFANLHLQRTGLNLLQQVIERCFLELFWSAIVCSPEVMLVNTLRSSKDVGDGVQAGVPELARNCLPYTPVHDQGTDQTYKHTVLRM